MVKGMAGEEREDEEVRRDEGMNKRGGGTENKWTEGWRRGDK